jgi:hypothetical protein
MINRTNFLAWSKNGVGPSSWLQVLEENYANLAATYRQKGMKREAELFANIVEEFQRIRHEIEELSAQP